VQVGVQVLPGELRSPGRAVLLPQSCHRAATALFMRFRWSVVRFRGSRPLP